MLVGASRNDRQAAAKGFRGMTHARIAVVVPSYARADRLRGCLEALAAQEGGPYPTFVVDDGSPDPLEPICRDFGGWVTCLRQENAGPAAARNAGARAAKADFLCFTDDDCRPRPGWVRGLVSAQGGDASLLIGGRVENALAENPFAATSQSIADWIQAYGFAAGELGYFTSNNMGCSAAGFSEVGGFDESFPLAAAEDRDFGLRWSARQGSLVHAPDAVVDHAHPLDLRRFWRQHANYGSGARHLHRLSVDRGRNRLEGLSFYAGLIAHPLNDRRLPLRERVLRTALVGLTQAAMLAGYLRAGRRRFR